MSATILAIDTSTQGIGLALYDGVQVISESVWFSHNRHTVELAPAVKNIITKAAITINDLGAVAVSMGPGSFTGLRIGMGLAKGLCLANHLPLIGIPTLDVLAIAQPVLNVPMAAILQAGRRRLAVGWYRAVSGKWEATGELEVLTSQELSKRIKTHTYICGELSPEDQRILRRKHKKAMLATPAQSLRRPGFLAELAWERWQASSVDDPSDLSPIYLHQHEPIPG
jgi:tRNA threonylcarbamoyladenosine biosynthesis protein TsaB